MSGNDSQDRPDRGAGRPRRRAALRRPLLLALALAALAVAGSAIAALASGGSPTAVTEHATSIARTSVVLNASVNPNGTNVTECYFEYGTSESALTSTAACSYLPGEVETPVAVSASISVSETTTYYYRIHAKSGAGESSGEVSSFTSLPTAPISNTEQASGVGHSSATMNAFVTPDGAEVTSCVFSYGTQPTALINQVPCSALPGDGGEPVAVHATVSGLAESEIYYYRVSSENSFGSTEGGRTHFETLPSAPRSNTEPAVSIGHTSATLTGLVTPNGAAVEECYFLWGTENHRKRTGRRANRRASARVTPRCR